MPFLSKYEVSLNFKYYIKNLLSDRMRPFNIYQNMVYQTMLTAIQTNKFQVYRKERLANWSHLGVLALFDSYTLSVFY